VLTRNLTQTLDIPHEPGHQVTIRKLSHHHLTMAEDARLDRVLDRAGKLTGIPVPQQTAEEREAAKAEAEKPENRYDRVTVLRCGITSWTYSEPIDEEAVRDLDEQTAAWVFDAILAFSLRSADERKAFASDSPPTSGLAEGAGPTS